MTTERPVRFQRDDEVERGSAARTLLPPAAHADVTVVAGRDPLGVLRATNERRLADLVPVRHQRMTESPIAFLRGLPALMTADLAALASSGVTTQLCGDAHLANFGFYSSPERSLVFDLNDFDETGEGPFEWDLKRLATSIVVAGRCNGHSAKVVEHAAAATVDAYRKHVRRWSRAGSLEVWYAVVDAEDVEKDTASHSRALVADSVRRAMAATGASAAAKLCVEVDGRRQIRADPPLLCPLSHDDPVGECLHELVATYQQSLEPSRQRLLERFQYVGGALKVVGVGSVGTRCYVLLLEDLAGGPPLFLQAKQEGPSAIERHLGPSGFEHHGERVVTGQRLLQAVSDPFLGWTDDEHIGGHFAVRQLRDGKGEIRFDELPAKGFDDYGELCAAALARAHSRAGSPHAIASYIGDGEEFTDAIVEFAIGYADQVERDHSQFAEAIADGWMS